MTNRHLLIIIICLLFSSSISHGIIAVNERMKLQDHFDVRIARMEANFKVRLEEQLKQKQP